jgi:hypothetical protein
VASEAEVARLLRAQGGVIRRQDHPELTAACDWLLRQGRLVAMLPGIYSVPGWRQNPHIAIRGALLAHPDGVLIGGAAARVSYWPTAPLDKVELAVPRKLTPQAGFGFSRQHVPPELALQRKGRLKIDHGLREMPASCRVQANGRSIFRANRRLGLPRAPLVPLSAPFDRPRTSKSSQSRPA